MQPRDVVFVTGDAQAGYPGGDQAWSPSTRYPEFADGECGDVPNPVYDLVRETFRLSGLDQARFGSPGWNPIGDLLKPGGRVVVKPNWVLHTNHSGGPLDCVVTHPSIVRAVVDYVLLARPSSLVVGDAPIQGCDLRKMWQDAGYDILREYYDRRGVAIGWCDFRRTIRTGDWIATTERNVRDTLDYVLFDVGSKSLLEPVTSDDERFRVTMYDARELARSHRPGVHRYLIAKDILDADLVINVPKLKTHKKAGITAALKNTIGMNGNKEFLPHHRKGSPATGGDCYPEHSLLKSLAENCLDSANRTGGVREATLRTAARACLAVARATGTHPQIEGGWAGNDTVWRTCLDLNRVLLYGTSEGELKQEPQRRLLNLTDGFISGEGDGPLAPSPRPTGWLTLSSNSAAADLVHTFLMSYDWQQIGLVREAFGRFEHPISACTADEVTMVTAEGRLAQPWPASLPQVFERPYGWAR